MSLEQLNPTKFEEIIYDNGDPCLVIFSRKSCHVCKEVVPVLEELKPKYEGKFGFYYVDVEDEKALFQRFSLKGVPQILFFNEGEYQGKMAGAVEDDKVEEKIAEVLGA
ncbi:thioredoxin domain-containing protein [Desulfitobacterium dichloroeliminans LMG P-21439]|uniref:Thioredoxin domain-containing protein n=1 Tax=Desulfitobacterium dichloroeliminans (strain LMG P-21439 / DCA1) TaxID=871963 RepID=L0F3F1_DESDL|nr:thioredoxin family protein [Desulfitobacterium dichloroeliminans]AGA68374.1 thioredoxin domain-containing protein [Desulfitobacterium dichloroeliminans LMG P-21439]